ncbi:MAG: TRAP transporter small permease subunit [Burkholderiales bacterium]
MTEVVVSEIRSRHQGPAGRLLIALCKAFAIGSALLLLLMAGMSLASIAGRALIGKPILGDYELVQVMSAAAVAMALPYCQLVRGHVIVDFFTARAPAAVNRALDIAANLLLALVAFLVAWRVGRGVLDLWRSADATMLIGFPTWTVYVPMSLSFLLLGIAALFTAWQDLRPRTSP